MQLDHHSVIYCNECKLQEFNELSEINKSTHFSFLVLLCINKNSLKDFSVLKLLILIYVLNLKHQCFCCSNATEIAFLEMNVLACMPRNMLHS